MIHETMTRNVYFSFALGFASLYAEIGKLILFSTTFPALGLKKYTFYFLFFSSPCLEKYGVVINRKEKVVILMVVCHPVVLNMDDKSLRLFSCPFLEKWTRMDSFVHDGCMFLHQPFALNIVQLK